MSCLEPAFLSQYITLVTDKTDNSHFSLLEFNGGDCVLLPGASLSLQAMCHQPSLTPNPKVKQTTCEKPLNYSAEHTAFCAENPTVLKK